MPIETEIKLLVAPERTLAIDAALRRLPGARRDRLDAHYFDTADGRLARNAIALRLRRSGRRWEQTLKAVGASAVEREEHNVARRGVGQTDDVPAIDPALHQGTPAGARLQAALADGAALLPIYRVRVVRRSALITHAGAQVEIAFDVGSIDAGERSEPICELEFELKHGDVAALVALSQEAVRVHGALLGVISKAERGARLARGEAAAVAHKAEASRLDASMSGPALRRAALRDCLAQVLANASEVAAGRWDDETVHQWRVGLRRLRTALRELGPLAASGVAPWAAPLDGAFRALGAYRDRGSVARVFGARLREAGAPEPDVVPVPLAASDDPAAIARDPVLQCALLDALGSVLAPVAAASDSRAGADPVDHASARLTALHRRLKRDARAYVRLDDAAQHAVRKRVKRLRYLCELVQALYPARKVARFLRALGPAQDALGELGDARLALTLARTQAQAQGGSAWFNVGWLAAQQPAGVRRCRKALRRVAQARPFWPGRR